MLDVIFFFYFVDSLSLYFSVQVGLIKISSYKETIKSFTEMAKLELSSTPLKFNLGTKSSLAF